MNQINHIRRRVFGVTQAEMGRIAGVPQSIVCRWELDQLQPRLPALRRIRAEALARGLAWDDRLFFELPREAA